MMRCSIFCVVCLHAIALLLRKIQSQICASSNSVCMAVGFLNFYFNVRSVALSLFSNVIIRV